MISLAEGAALLQKQHEAAHAAGRPLRLRMQVRSFDAVCHLVASGLGIAVLPRTAALPILAAMKLRWRALSDPWASRRLLVATRSGPVDPAVQELVEFLAEPSQKAKPRAAMAIDAGRRGPGDCEPWRRSVPPAPWPASRSWSWNSSIAGPSPQDAGRFRRRRGEDRSRPARRRPAQLRCRRTHFGVVAGGVAQQERSVALDLRQRQAQGSSRAAARRRRADRDLPSRAHWKAGLDPQASPRRNSRLVVLRISGMDRPALIGDRPGFGVIGEAMGGLRHLTGEPGRVPVRVGFRLATRSRRFTA